MSSILIIGQLLETVGTVEGRKKFQKLVHILQHFGVPFRFRFGYLHYGPYSSELDAQLESFETEGLIKEEPVAAGKYQAYHFSAQEKLSSLVKKLTPDASLPLAELAQDLNAKSSSELEAVSTIYYLQDGGKRGSELKAAFCSLKPQYASVFDKRLKMAKEFEMKYKK